MAIYRSKLINNKLIFSMCPHRKYGSREKSHSQNSSCLCPSNFLNTYVGVVIKPWRAAPRSRLMMAMFEVFRSLFLNSITTMVRILRTQIQIPTIIAGMSISKIRTWSNVAVELFDIPQMFTRMMVVLMFGTVSKIIYTECV